MAKTLKTEMVDDKLMLVAVDEDVVATIFLNANQCEMLARICLNAVGEIKKIAPPTPVAQDNVIPLQPKAPA